MWGGPWTEADTRVAPALARSATSGATAFSRAVRAGSGTDATSAHCESCCDLLTQDKRFIVL